MKRRILTALLAVCLVVALGTIGAFADSSTLPDPDENGNIILTEDVSLASAYTVDAGETITLDLAGFNITAASTSAFIVNGKLIIKDSTAVTSPVVSSDYSSVTYTSGEITSSKTTVLAQNGGQVIVESGSVISTGNIALYANGNTSQSGAAVTSSIVVNGGFVKAREFAGSAQGNGASFTVTGGVLFAEDNAALGGNGTNNSTDNRSGTTMTISGGTLISNIITPGYIACGIYHPQQGLLTITGGTIVANGGVGILMRAGGADISGGTIIASGNVNGKVGDSSVQVPSCGIVYDLAANYPSLEKADDAILSGTVSVTGGQGALSILTASGDSEPHDNIVVYGGTYKDASGADKGAEEFIPDNVSMKVDDNGNVVADDATTVATVNGVGYSDLQDAFNAAESGDTVKLLKSIDVAMDGVASNNGALTIANDGVKFDGGNFTITATGTNDNGSTHVLLITGDNVEVSNLTVDAANIAKGGAIQAFQATGVELNNVTVKNSRGAGLIVNGSSVTATAFNTVNNAWGGVNVDTGSNPVDTKFVLKSGNVETVYTDNDETTKSAEIVVDGGTVGTIYNHVDAGDGNNKITINGGNVTELADLSETSQAVITVTGGTFGMDITGVADTHPNYQVQSGSNYSYYATSEEALAAAGAGDVVTYVGDTSTTTTYTVTFKLFDNNSYTVTVPSGTKIKLPSESRTNYYLAGWKCNGVTYNVGYEVQVNTNLTFTAIWKNGEYDITIDSTIKHGDITTNVSSADKDDIVYIYVDPNLGYKLKDINVYYTIGTNKYPVTVYTASAAYTYDYYFKMPSNSVVVTATFEPDGMPFVDVRPYQWHYDAVYYAWSNGLMEGDSDYTFNPDGKMTRAMFWAVLGRIDGETITGTDWVDEARTWAMAEGVSDGTDPYGEITREQMVTMLWRYLGEPKGSAYLSIYTDANTISSWAKDAMVWAIDEGIIEGITSTTIVPRGTATRAQCATIFMRAEID